MTPAIRARGRAKQSRRKAASPATAALRAILAISLGALFLAMLLAPPFLALGKGARVANSLYDRTDVPETPELPRTTFVYDRHGRLLMQLHGAIDRTPIAFRSMPKSLRHAVIAAEDADFYREGGVSLRAIIRAAIVNLKHQRVVQGGSTITQQYVKDVYTSGARTMSRKIREAIIAQKLSRRLTKRQILQKYLNEVYFGRGAYGVQAAAQTYFGIDASKLDVEQSATLAGIIAAPSRFDPISNRKEAADRRNYVLKRMAQLSYISKHRAHRIAKRELRTAPPDPPAIPGRYFLSYVRKALEQKYGTKRTFEGGLRVVTSLDVRLQRAARHAVNTHLSAPGDPSAAVVAIDPASGQVVAMVGGRSEKKTKFNLATQARRQAGSAFKPFTLAAALEQGISLQSRWNGPPALLITDPRCETPDPETNLPGPWNVSNYEDEQAGTMTLMDATANSVNTIFSQLVLDVGPENVASMAHRMGVKSPLQPVCSITLGTQPVTPLDMTAGYATLASHGVRHEPTGILRVRDPAGRFIGRIDREGAPVLDPGVADAVTFALQGVVEHGTGTYAAIGRPVAGKTGTAQNYQDAWFCGYVPQLVACVWVGYPEGEIPMQDVEGFPNVFGGSIPALIWHDFMTRALANVPPATFPTPSFAGYDKFPKSSVSPKPKPSPKKSSPPPSNQTSAPPSSPKPRTSPSAGGGGIPSPPPPPPPPSPSSEPPPPSSSPEPSPLGNEPIVRRR